MPGSTEALVRAQAPVADDAGADIRPASRRPRISPQFCARAADVAREQPHRRGARPARRLWPLCPDASLSLCLLDDDAHRGLRRRFWSAEMSPPNLNSILYGISRVITRARTPAAISELLSVCRLVVSLGHPEG